MSIKIITASRTYPIRQLVLRAGKTIDTCKMPGDDLKNTFHLGYYFKQQLVGVASLMKEDLILETGAITSYRLRGMAVLESARGNGIGAKLLKYAEQLVATQNIKVIWFNARVTAVAFYERYDYKKIGKEFYISDIGAHFKMMKQL